VWNLNGGEDFTHFNISSNTGKFKFLNIKVNKFSISQLGFIDCNNNAILDECKELEVMGVASTDKSLIKLGGGTSKVSDSVSAFFVFIDFCSYLRIFHTILEVWYFTVKQEKELLLF
jgi:hypothetical protein